MTTLSRRAMLQAAGSLSMWRSTSAGQTAAPVITLTCADYVRFMPIATGDVKPDGMTLRWIRG